MIKTKIPNLVLITIAILAFLAAPLLKTNFEAPLSEELLCDSGPISPNYDFFYPSLERVLYCAFDDVIFIQSMIAYLAKHENSPPI